MWIEKYQGEYDDGQKFGYVGENNGGGYYFTWAATETATIASIEADTQDRPVRLTVKGAEKVVRKAYRKEKKAPYSRLIPR